MSSERTILRVFSSALALLVPVCSSSYSLHESDGCTPSNERNVPLDEVAELAGMDEPAMEAFGRLEGEHPVDIYHDDDPSSFGHGGGERLPGWLSFERESDQGSLVTYEEVDGSSCDFESLRIPTRVELRTDDDRVLFSMRTEARVDAERVLEQDFADPGTGTEALIEVLGPPPEGSSLQEIDAQLFLRMVQPGTGEKRVTCLGEIFHETQEAPSPWVEFACIGPEDERAESGASLPSWHPC